MKGLWIDDDRFRCENLISLFDLYGMEVNHFSTGESGLFEIENNTNSYSFILLDLMMPFGRLNNIETFDGDYTGIALYQMIREIYKGPIIFYSVCRKVKKIEELLNKDDKLAYLTKPSSIERIIEVITLLTK